MNFKIYISATESRRQFSCVYRIRNKFHSFDRFAKPQMCGLRDPVFFQDHNKIR